MKKLSFIVAMALAVVANYSCGEQDNSVFNDGKITITDANGKPYEVSPVTTLQSTPGSEVTVAMKIYDGKDYYALKSGNKVVSSMVNDQEYAIFSPITVADDGEIQLLGNKDIHSLIVIGAALENFNSEKLRNRRTLDRITTGRLCSPHRW